MKKLFTLGSILLAAALTLCCAGCGEEASSKEETTSSASSKATADELTDFDGTVKTDLSKLHEVDYENGNAATSSRASPLSLTARTTPT